MSEMMRASRQWASRPVDERFWGLADLATSARAARDASTEKVCQLGQLSARPKGDDIVVIGPNGGETTPTNWGFAQLCRLIKAPADYITGLPSDLASQCINVGLKGKTDSVNVLLQKNGHTQLRAITSAPTDDKPNKGYKRFWDYELADLLTPAVANGFKVPPARPADQADNRARPATEADLIPGMSGGAQVGVGDIIAPSGVYRGDRDSFVFLVSPDKGLDDNGNGGLFKGIIASNSEVGKASICLQSFCHQGVCGNHIVWGVSKEMTLKRKHYGDLTPFLNDIKRWVASYTMADLAAHEEMIVKAKALVLGKDCKEVEEKIHGLATALTYKAIRASYEYATKWEHTAGATPNTAWGFVHGLTRYSQTLGFADARLALDVAGGKVLDLAV